MAGTSASANVSPDQLNEQVGEVGALTVQVAGEVGLVAAQHPDVSSGTGHPSPWSRYALRPNYNAASVASVAMEGLVASRGRERRSGAGTIVLTAASTVLRPARLAR